MLSQNPHFTNYTEWVWRVALDKSEVSVKANFSLAVPKHRCIRQRG